MSVSGQDAIIDGLALSLAGTGDPVERIATHGAVVLLAGDRAYKIKRAVKYPYMDFSTLALREEACRAELAVNRRTAPQLYLDVVAVIAEPDGSIRSGSGEAGRVVEWAVMMRRFEQGCLFDRMATAGRLDTSLIRSLARTIARFHREAAPIRGLDLGKAVHDLVRTNRDRLLEHAAVFPSAEVAALTAKALGFVDRQMPALEDRSVGGFVRHCHGDLHLGNVALIDGKPVLFDAIEFNRTFAEIDVFYDLAFMLMDLEHRRHRDFANLLLSAYLELTEDYAGLALLPLYLSIRAAVRAHVGAQAASLDPDAANASVRRAEAAHYLGQAKAYLDPAPPRLVAIGGVSGTGKSTLARLIAPELGPPPGAVVLRSDVIRKRMFGVEPTQRLSKAGYAPGVSERVFAEIARAAGRTLAAGHACIADAVYGEERHRRGIAAAAAETGAPFTGLWLEANPELLERRVRQREGDASDADVKVLRSQLAHVAAPREWLRIDAAGSPEEIARNACEAMAGRSAIAPAAAARTSRVR